MRRLVLTNCLTLLVFMMHAQTTFPLYEGEIPNSKPVKDQELTKEWNGIKVIEKISNPKITMYPPKGKANGTSVIIFPGGGYWVNAIQHEGIDVANKLNEAGITAFVVKYRIPDSTYMTDKKTGPLQDAQQAIAYVRKNASKWNLKPDRIGIMGFSAGGHLASTAGTHFEKPVLDYGVSVRPDFMILVYPVISFQTNIGHLGSRDQLIGPDITEDNVTLYSNELQITDKTPPTFLVHAVDDDAVPVANSIVFFQNLVSKKIPAELHVYQEGGHGFGLVNKTSKDLWLERCRNWMDSNGWLQ